MDISVRGWARDMGWKEILRHELVDAELSDDQNRTVSYNRPPKIFKSYGGVSITWGRNLSLMGDYRIEAELSKSDVMHLFKLAFGSELKAKLLEQGFTASDDLKEAVLRTVKLSDVTLGDLAAMTSTKPDDQPATADKLIEASNVRPFTRRL
ncbi:MAG: hypothetical protein K2P86_07500 [Xanthobacteraceae bacterium]|nr:hypothetical protein [Xanthobacteraceae bacterium]